MVYNALFLHLVPVFAVRKKEWLEQRIDTVCVNVTSSNKRRRLACQKSDTDDSFEALAVQCDFQFAIMALFLSMCLIYNIQCVMCNDQCKNA